MNSFSRKRIVLQRDISKKDNIRWVTLHLAAKGRIITCYESFFFAKLFYLNSIAQIRENVYREKYLYICLMFMHDDCYVLCFYREKYLPIP